MPAPAISQRDLHRLRRWLRQMIGFFVATWLYILLIIAAYALLEPSRVVIRLALIPVLGLVIGSIILQFSARCPSCGYRLGRQSGLRLPDRCRSCDAPLRVADRGG